MTTRITFTYTILYLSSMFTFTTIVNRNIMTPTVQSVVSNALIPKISYAQQEYH